MLVLDEEDVPSWVGLAREPYPPKRAFQAVHGFSELQALSRFINRSGGYRAVFGS